MAKTDMNRRLSRMMHEAGYRLKTWKDVAWGDKTAYVDKDDNFVGYPPGYVTRVRGTNSKGNPCCQLNIRRADGAWDISSTGREDHMPGTIREQIIICCELVEKGREEGDKSAALLQIAPLIRLVAEEFAEDAKCEDFRVESRTT